MRYVDGFLIPIPKKNIPEYTKMAKEGAKIWKKFGALEYMECVSEDVKPKHVVMTFPRLTKLKPTETIIFAFIVFKSRKHRDEVNAKVMKYFDEKYANKEMSMPFDMKRFSYGGFEAIVQK